MAKCIETREALEQRIKVVLVKANAIKNPQDRLETLAQNLHKVAMDTPLEIKTSEGGSIYLRSLMIDVIDKYRNKFSNLLAVMPNPRIVMQEGFNIKAFKLADDTRMDSDESLEAQALNSQVKSEFFKDKFGDALGAQLYYLRQAKDSLISIFLADRDAGVLVTDLGTMNVNVRKYKQKLIDLIKSYLELIDVSLNDKDGNPINTTLYENSRQKSITLFLEIASNYLDTTLVNKKNLTEQYNKFKLEKDNRAKSFITAYNAYLTLNNFDTILKYLMPGIVEITNPTLVNSHKFSNHKYKFIDKATNMWSNGLGDEVENIGELVSVITQTLVESSRVYTWGNEQPLEDLYLSFAAFNSVIAKIKKLATNDIAKNTKLKSLKVDALSEETKAFIKTYSKYGYTIADLVAGIDSNPLKYFHMIFDILANCREDTSLADSLGIELYFKNLIWTVNKEIFGNSQNTPRALHNLLVKTGEGFAYTILTLLGCSMFSEDFIQYYPDVEGNMSTRRLSGYGLYIELQHLLDEINSKSSVFNPELFKTLTDKYSIVNNPTTKLFHGVTMDFIGDLSFEIPISTSSKIIAVVPKLGMITTNLGSSTGIVADRNIYNNPGFKSFIKDCLGIDLQRDSDLSSTFVQMFGNDEDAYGAAALALVRLCGKVLYAQYFNNVILPNTLQTLGLNYNIANCEDVVKAQYETNTPRINRDLGTIPILLPTESSYLEQLAQARSILKGSLAAAQVKTGEGTNVSNYALSNLKAQHLHQLLLNRKGLTNSAIKGLTYVSGIDLGYGYQVNPCMEVLTRREVKTTSGAKTCTSFSTGESFLFSFINDWVSAFAKATTNMYDVTGAGKAAFLTTINSDKTRIDLLIADLNTPSHQPIPYNELSENELKSVKDTVREILYNKPSGEVSPVFNVTYGELSDAQIESEIEAIVHRDNFVSDYTKPYLKLTNEEIENEIQLEFSPVYSTILNNVNTDLATAIKFLVTNTQVRSNDGSIVSMTNAEFLFGKPFSGDILAYTSKFNNLAELHTLLLKGLNEYFASVNVKPKDGMRLLTNVYNNGHYNKTIGNYTGTVRDSHKISPLKFGLEIHYIFAKNGDLTFNPTLLSLWARFSANSAGKTFVNNLDIYQKTVKAKDGSTKNVDHSKYATTSGFFKYKDYLTAKDLLNSNFKVYLNNPKTNQSKEVTYLLNNYSTWVNNKGEMIIAKVGNEEITSTRQLARYSPEQITLHPMLSKFNRMDYLFTQQYVLSTVGSHYVHKSKASNVTVIEEEAARLNAANKRNNALTATVHKLLRGVIDGTASRYRISIMEDIKSKIYNPMGITDSHKPLDGGMMCNGWVSILENNSLGSERAGWDKKPFGTFFFGEYAAGGTIKTASFACTNELMRKYPTYRHLQKNMSNMLWILRRPAADGTDLYYDDLNILNNDLGVTNPIFRQEGNSYVPVEPIYYMREVNGVKNIYQLNSVQYLGNNQYTISEIQVNKEGDPIETETIDRKATIDTNWKIFTELFGGYEALEKSDTGYLKYSENSLELMARTLNNVGSWVSGSKPNNQIITLDAFYQPLKYSEIQYIANEGAIKSAYTNINTAECLHKDVDLDFFTIPLSQLGIQLDKEHEADDSLVSMPTQIIQACIDRGFTLDEAIEVYEALATLTGLATQLYLDEIDLMQNSQYTGALQTHIANQILEEVLASSGDNEAILLVLSTLVSKYKETGKVVEDDVLGQIAWSNSRILNQIYAKIASKLTNTAIKMKFSGNLAVICPTHGISLLHGNKTRGYYQTIDNGVKPEEILIQEELERIKDPANKDPRLIYDSIRDVADADLASANLNKASHIDFLHWYTVEFANGTTQDIEVNTVADYEQIKKWLAPADGSVSNVKKIYENIIHNRELAAMNYRFKSVDTVGLTEFCLYDLQSSRELFKIRELREELAKLDSIEGINLVLTRYNLLNTTVFPKLSTILDRIRGKLLSEGIETNTPEYWKRYAELSEILLRKELHKDLRKLSPNYAGSDREIMCNGEMIEVDPASLEVIPYELIMSKVFKSLFGLTDAVDLLKILEDPNFFSKRAVTKLGIKHVDDSCFTIELKSNDGNHQYIMSKEVFDALPESVKQLFEKNPNFFTTKMGDEITRIDLQAKPMYKMANSKDIVYKVGNYEVLVTSDVNHYLNNLNYDYIVASKQASKDTLTKIIANLPLSRTEYVDLIKTLSPKMRNATTKAEKAQILKQIDALLEITNKALENFKRLVNYSQVDGEGDYLWYEHLQEEADSFSKLTPDLITQYLNNEVVNKSSYAVASHRADNSIITNKLSLLLDKIIANGDEQFVSFKQSLDVIAGRIPAQSQLSFMIQRVVAYDDRDANTARVSTFQLFLLGSDLDIDTVNLLCYDFDKHGKFISWTPYGGMLTEEQLKATKEMPFPTGKKVNATVDDTRDSFFTTYKDYFGIGRLFLLAVDDHNEVHVILDDESPDGIRQLAAFIRDVNKHGLNIKHPKLGLQEEITNTDFLSFDYDAGMPATLYQEIDTLTLHTLYSTGNTTYTIPQVWSIYDQIAGIVNLHNEYIVKVNPTKKASMAKNQAFWGMWKVASDPTNVEEGMIGIDLATGTAKGLAALSESAEHDLEAAPGSVITKHAGIVEGQVGKNCVSIGAVAIKVNAFTLLYYDLILNSDDETIKPYLISSPLNIAGEDIITIDNIFDKTTELSPDGTSMQLNPLVKAMIDSLANKYAWTLEKDSSIEMAALLSIAVDNAKDLALAKLNAGPTMIGMYDYGSQCGIPLEYLEKIINSPVGKMVANLTLDNSFNEDPSERSAVKALEFLEGKIDKYLKLWNQPIKNKDDVWISVPNLIKTYNVFIALYLLKRIPKFEKFEEAVDAYLKSLKIDTKNQSFEVKVLNLLDSRYLAFSTFLRTLFPGFQNSWLPILKKANDGYLANKSYLTKQRGKGITLSDALAHLLRPYYLEYCFDKGVKAKESLGGMITTLVKNNLMQDAIVEISKSPIYLLLVRYYDQQALAVESTNNFDVKNQALELMSWLTGFNSLLRWVTEYNTKVQHFYNDTVELPNGKVVKLRENLWNLAEGGEEMRVIGVICSSNKRVRTKPEEAETFAKTIEDCIINRIDILKSRYWENTKLQEFNTAPYKIDFIKFMRDANYRKLMYSFYEHIPGIPVSIKVRTNPLHMIEVDPHLFKYVEANIIPQAAMSQMSCKYRATHKYDTKDYRDMFGISGTLEQKAYLTSLDMLLNAKLLKLWLLENKMTFKVPAGFKIFKSKYSDSDDPTNMELVPTTEDTPILLGTNAGLATFKRYMELEIIPKLKDNPLYLNSFIKDLIPVTKTKTASRQPTQVYTLDVSMMPKKDSPEEARLREYISDFLQLATIDFNQFSRKSGSISNLVDAFYLYSMYSYNGRKGPDSLMKLFDVVPCSFDKSYNKYIASLDASADLDISDDELIAWCAPLRSTHSTLGEYAYVYDDSHLGPILSKKIDYSPRPMSEEDQERMDLELQAREEALAYDEDQNQKRSGKRRPNWKQLNPDKNLDMSQLLASQYFIYPNASVKASNIETDITSTSGKLSAKLTIDKSTGKILKLTGIPKEVADQIKNTRIIKPAMSPTIVGIAMLVDTAKIKAIIDMYENEKNNICK